MALKSLETSSLMLMVPAISTITYFSGVPPVEYLKDRTGMILAANPWLQGKLRKTGNGIDLVYDDDTRVDQSYHMVEDASIHDGLKYDALVDNIKKYFVKDGNGCLNNNNPLFKITIAVTSKDKFAIIFSLSHMIGDGHTFYELYGMLSSKETVRPLIVDRDDSYEEWLRTSTHCEDTINYLFSPAQVFNQICTMFFAPRPEMSVSLIDLDWVAREKEAHKHEEGISHYVSTNDVLTSWIFRLTRCDAGLMNINFRGRHARSTSSHAGNYESILGYQPADYAIPGLIRKSLSNYRRAVSGPWPGPVASMRSRVSLLSSWVTFYRDLVLGEGEGEREASHCRQLLHMPCSEAHNPPFADFFVLFRPNGHSLALLSSSRSLRHCRLEGEPALAPFTLGGRRLFAEEASQSPGLVKSTTWKSWAALAGGVLVASVAVVAVVLNPKAVEGISLSLKP